jgi:hypothetical protein
MNGHDALVDDDSATPSGSLTPVHDVSINETPLSLRRETSLTLHRESSLKIPELSPDNIEAKVSSNFGANTCSSNPRFQDQVMAFDVKNIHFVKYTIRYETNSFKINYFNRQFVREISLKRQFDE